MQQDHALAAAWFGQDIIHDLFHQVPARDQIAWISRTVTDQSIRDDMPRQSVVPTMTPALRTVSARATPIAQVDMLRLSIEDRLAKHDPDTLAKMQAQPRSDRFRTAKLIWRMGVRDPHQATMLAAIIYGTGLNILTEPAFSYATKNPFLSANAKSRQLIAAYHLVAAQKTKGT